MSAAAAVLPLVWAYAAPAEVQERKGPILASASRPKAASEAVPAAVPVSKQVAFYRKYTEAMLRRYVRLSMEAGRTPSLLGRELFRGKVMNYEVKSFDDSVIFVHDVGQCVAKLDSGQQYLIRKIALQEYTQGETAATMGLSLSTVIRRYGQAIDRLTCLLINRGLLDLT